MNDNSQARPALNRSDVEAALARIAVATFMYYPEKATEEPGYLVDEDVDWAMGPLRAMDADEFERWRARVSAVISDASRDRRAFLADLMSLAED
ncbi:MAG: hypothetical protein CMH35_03505 [Microbacterium sp.]|uniref:hypothetical protein n=1 Tax=Microbacterium sp. UBA3394 TaxID=1946945 RepID=UPI000C5A66CD|nr:hypothetical protein [Microbacterium sp. UBA3394]MAM53906.1 hypothetical protein [Microbacterium sp.]|tara:strand:+ start:2981 stop:3262 length:282 start_codon:yes stop_codon:yes gene_type:complete